MLRWMRTGMRVTVLASLLGACAGLSDVVADLTPAADAEPAGEEHLDAGPGPNAVREPDSAGEDGSPAEGARDGGIAAASDAGVCLGSLAAQTFRHALCACQTLDLSFWGLTTDAYDSTSGPYDPRRALTSAAHVGVNAKLAGTNPIAVGGSLTVAAALGPDALPALLIAGDLRVGGRFSYARDVEVGQNLWLASDLQGAAPLHVAGDLIQNEAGEREASVPLRVDGRELRMPVTIPEPCACGADQLLDIQAFVAAAKAHNDNDAAGISPDRLAVALVDDRVVLPDGKRIFLTSIGLALGTPVDGAFGGVTFVVEGRSTLVVESLISLGGALNLELAPDAELDMFVGGDVSIGVLQAPATGANRPARLRVYVGGTYFHGQVFAAANVYAPRAWALVLDNDHHGSLFASDINASGGELRVHYDTSVLAEGRDCDWFDLTAAP